MLAAGDTAVHSGFSEFTYFPANLRLLPAFTAPAASTKFGLQIANQILLAIYNSYKTDLVLSVRRYSIPRRVRRREPRGAALRTGVNRCKLTFLYVDLCTVLGDCVKSCLGSWPVFIYFYIDFSSILGDFSVRGSEADYL